MFVANVKQNKEVIKTIKRIVLIHIYTEDLIMSKYTGTKTEKNLEAAFAGESQARNKYTYYASKAKKDGYEQIAAIFTETADNEKEHAKIWFKLLHDGMPKKRAMNR